MHMLIRGLVYATDEREALVKATHTVFEPLVRDQVFEYYHTFDEEGRSFTGRDRWGPLPAAATAASTVGTELIEDGWDATVAHYETQLGRLAEFFTDYELSAYWEDFETHHEYQYDFHGVGEFRGPNTFLYDQRGQGVRDRSHFDTIYRENTPETPRAETLDNDTALYVVPAAAVTDYG